MNAAVEPTQASATAEDRGASGVPTTSAQAIDQWMTENGITDPSTMSRSDWADLLTYLKSLASSGANIPGLNSTIQGLKAALKANPPTSGTAAEQHLADLKLQRDALNAIDPQHVKYGDTIAKLDSQIVALDKLINDINMSISSNSFDPNSTREDIQNQIDLINALEAAGVPIEQLGLAEYRNQLQSALAAYDSAMAGKDPASTDGKLELSKLREATLSAKLNYLTSTGASKSSAEVDATEAGLRGEEIRQTRLLSPTEDTSANPKELTKEGIKKTMADLKIQYEQAAAEGDLLAMAHIEAKMTILQRALDMLEQGKDPLLVGVITFYDLRVLDIESKSKLQYNLRQEISTLQDGPNANDPAVKERIEDLQNQVNQLESEIEQLFKQLSQVMDQYKSALDTLTQNTNESISKAF